jgi:protein-L-isoaspartate(D-aspartate) O-methyltransferase
MNAGYQMTPDEDPRHIYDTVLVALDASRGLNNGEPSSLLRFLDILDLAPGDRFLHIGCGVGYYTAIAAQAVLPNGHVIGVEMDRQLADRAKRNLQRYENADAICADGNEFTDGPFDAIFVNAGVTDIHAAWLDQLAEGGRLLVPMTIAFPGGRAAGLPADVAALFSEAGGGITLLVTKRSNKYFARFELPVAIFHCIGARSAEGEKILGEALRRGGPTDVKSLRRDQHSADTECWLHASAFCLSRSAV